MRLVFPIYRFNWYRTVAPVIDEALRRGFEVECWHNVSIANFESNRPTSDKMPRFLHGEPTIHGYKSEEELEDRIMKCTASAVISIDLPLDRWIEKEEWMHRKFRYITITTTDTLRRLIRPENLDSTDLISVRSDREVEACIQDHTTDYRPWMEKARRDGADGARFIHLMEPRIGNEWSDSSIQSFRSKAVIAGYPFLDALQKVDRNEVRERWSIPPDQPVVGFWSTPTQGRGFHGHWDRLFAERDPLRFRCRAVRAYGWKGLRMPYLNEKKILQVVQSFAHKNGAILITKLRHYQKPGESLYSSYTDRVVGEDGYYPHTALELSAIADVMIGFHTTGMTEAVYAGSPVINLVIPGFPQDLHMNTLHFFDGMYDCPGVVYRVKVEEAVEKLPGSRLEDFPMRERESTAYKKKYCGPDAGPFASNLLDAIERLG